MYVIQLCSGYLHQAMMAYTAAAELSITNPRQHFPLGHERGQTPVAPGYMLQYHSLFNIPYHFYFCIAKTPLPLTVRPTGPLTGALKITINFHGVRYASFSLMYTPSCTIVE